jgi:MFS family permease
LVPIAHSFPELLFYRFLGGWASQMWLIARLAIIADTGATRQRGRQITGMIGLEGIGRLLGPAIGGFAATWDIRIPFLLHGLLCIVAIIPSFKMIRETAPSRSAGEADGPGHGGSHPATSRFSLFVFPIILLLGVQLLVALTRGVIWGGTLDLYGVYAYDIGAKTLGILNAINSTIGIPLTFAAGYLMDRFGRKATIVPGFSLLAASFVFMAFTAHYRWSFPVFVAAYLCVNFAQGVTSGSMQTLGSDLAPADARGQFFGTWRMVQEIGSVLSPTLFTLISEYQGFTAAFLFLCVTAFSVAFLVGTQVPETLKR